MTTWGVCVGLSRAEPVAWPSLSSQVIPSELRELGTLESKATLTPPPPTATTTVTTETAAATTPTAGGAAVATLFYRLLARLPFTAPVAPAALSPAAAAPATASPATASPATASPAAASADTLNVRY